MTFKPPTVAAAADINAPSAVAGQVYQPSASEQLTSQIVSLGADLKGENADLQGLANQAQSLAIELDSDQKRLHDLEAGRPKDPHSKDAKVQAEFVHAAAEFDQSPELLTLRTSIAKLTDQVAAVQAAIVAKTAAIERITADYHQLNTTGRAQAESTDRNTAAQRRTTEAAAERARATDRGGVAIKPKQAGQDLEKLRTIAVLLGQLAGNARLQLQAGNPARPQTAPVARSAAAPLVNEKAPSVPNSGYSTQDSMAPKTQSGDPTHLHAPRIERLPLDD